MEYDFLSPEEKEAILEDLCDKNGRDCYKASLLQKDKITEETLKEMCRTAGERGQHCIAYKLK